MKRVLFIALAVMAPGIAALAGGCKSPAAYVRQRNMKLTDDKPVVLQSTVHRRFVYFVKQPNAKAGEKGVVIYAEPPPDAALEATLALAAKIKSPADAVDGDGSINYATNVIELTKRTQAIVILRDSLFRIAEGRANGWLGQDDYKSKFSEVLKVAQTIALADLAANTADAIEAAKSPPGNKSLAPPQPDEQQKAINQLLEGLRRRIDPAAESLGGDGSPPRP